MSVYSLPKPDDVPKVLGTLLNKPVTAAQGQAVSSPSVAATYIDQQGGVGAVCLVDASFAAYAGAALTMIPSDVAASEIKTGQLSSEILENLQEVFNVMVAFFNQGKVPHIRFADMHATPADFPAEVETLRNGDAQHTDIEITIGGYGAGTMTLYSL